MIEYTLWGEEDTPKEKFFLHEPDDKERKRWEDTLNGYYAVPELQALVQPLLNLITSTPVQILTRDGKVKEASAVLSVLQRSGNKRKADWLQLAAFFLASERNLAFYVQSLNEEEVCAWKILITKLYANNRMFKSATGKDWIIQGDTWLSHKMYTPIREASWFTMTKSSTDKINQHGYREKDAYLFLQPAFRQVFAPLFFPEVKVVPSTSEELPAQNLFTFQGEVDFIRCFPLMKALYKQGIMTMGVKKMSATTIKKVSRQINLKEFFEGDVPDELNVVRASLVLPVMTLLFCKNQKTKEKNAEDLLKTLKQFLCSYYVNLVPVLFPNINGIKSNKIPDSTIPHLVSDVMFTLSRAGTGWLSVKDLEESYLVHPIGLNNLQIFKPYQLEGMDLFNRVTGEYIHLGNLTEHLGVPFLKGLLFLMGGLGMLELAYEYPSLTASSVFNTLRYVRLTELGKYALELASTYTPPSLEVQELFHLDEDRLLIRSLLEGNPYESLLQDTAIPIGNHRFMMNNDSFLKNCKTEKDAKDKIAFFKQFICQGVMPEIWSEFFESLLNQCHPLKKSKEDYIIYQLDGKNKELIRLLTSDSILKSIIIRAEGYKILVEVKNQRKLIERLKTYGYLL